MGVKKWNEIFGYVFFSVGALKILLVILVLIQFGINVTAIFNGGDASSSSYDTFSTILAFAQIILAIGSIIMIILNITNKQPEVIIGYLLGLGATLLEFIVPSFLSFYFVFVECGMYMKAGTKIRNENVGQNTNNRNIKQAVKNTDWFYGNDDK